MLARAFVFLPYSFDIPDGASFSIGTWATDRYKVTVQVPIRVPDLDNLRDKSTIEVDGLKTFKARALVIDFAGVDFDRREGAKPTDPSSEDVFNVANWILQRIRTVTKAGHITQVGPLDTPWRVTYLNDDLSELPAEKGKIRGFGTHRIEMRVNVITPKIWDSINQLPIAYETPPWVTLLLDARRLLPETGPPIVLATAALETLIRFALETLARNAHLPEGFWAWLNNRTPLDRQPSLTEEYGALLKMLSGKSLEDEPELWEGFQNLRTARNSFVHEGEARIGKSKQPVSREEVGKLIANAEKIVEFVRKLLPAEAQWPVFNFEQKVVITMPLFDNQEKPISEGHKVESNLSLAPSIPQGLLASLARYLERRRNAAAFGAIAFGGPLAALFLWRFGGDGGPDFWAVVVLAALIAGSLWGLLMSALMGKSQSERRM